MYDVNIAHCHVNKYGEELCGDNVEVVSTEDGKIVVLSDGLGSGVKANILATLTSKIAITMLRAGASIEDTIMTVMNTLPECQVRKLAYSTFTIIHVKNNGVVYMVEYDNPPIFFYRDNKPYPIYKEKRIINGKEIYESKFRMQKEDILVVVSDGAIHAGVGKTLNLGWEWQHIDEYLCELVQVEDLPQSIAKSVLEVCDNLYQSRPGDDTTVVAVGLNERCYLDLFTGPPKRKEDDIKLIQAVKEAKGKKILCGGTTGNIVSRELKEEIHVDLKNYTMIVPPMGYMRGVDFVTEGLLTLNSVKSQLERYIYQQQTMEVPERIEGDDGASKIARMIVEEATQIHIWLGQAVNPAHQNPDFPANFNLKNKVVIEIVELIKELGKKVELTII